MDGHRGVAAERLAAHLSKIDWSHQTEGRQRILDAFLKLATLHSLPKVSMRMLANEVNVKPPSIYAHFPDGRDELVAECLRWNYSRFGLAVLDAVDDAHSPDDFWERMIRVHVYRQVTMPECELWDIVIATDKYARVLAPQVRRDVDEWLALYSAMYEAVARDMGFEGSGPVVRVLMTLLDGAQRWVHPDRDLAAIEECAAVASSLGRSLLGDNLPALGSDPVMADH